MLRLLGYDFRIKKTSGSAGRLFFNVRRRHTSPTGVVGLSRCPRGFLRVLVGISIEMRDLKPPLSLFWRYDFSVVLENHLWTVSHLKGNFGCILNDSKTV